MHGHGFSCEKGKKGKYMCRLVFKRGLHNGKTCLLLVILFRSENVEKKIKVDVRSFPSDKHTIKLMKTPIDALTGEFKQKHPMGPVVWEQTRNKQMHIIVRITLLQPIFKTMQQIHHQLQMRRLAKLQKNI
jgi:hypothetical protein